MTEPAPRSGLQRWRAWAAKLIWTAGGSAVAAAVLVAAALGPWIWRSCDQLLPGAFWRSWWLEVPDLLIALAAGLVLGSVLVLLAQLVKWQLPWLVVCAVMFEALLLVVLGAGASLPGWVAITVIVLAAAGSWGPRGSAPWPTPPWQARSP